MSCKVPGGKHRTLITMPIDYWHKVSSFARFAGTSRNAIMISALDEFFARREAVSTSAVAEQCAQVEQAPEAAASTNAGQCAQVEQAPEEAAASANTT